MKLPAELRLVIYELALEDVIPTRAPRSPTKLYITSCGLSRARGALALLLASKEVRAESSKAMMPSMLRHLESYKMRVKLLSMIGMNFSASIATAKTNIIAHNSY